MELLGKDLIFIISLPRSGSTLLQHILAGHSKIAATAEPWVLFPAMCALRENALTADYNASIGRLALKEFVERLDGGEENYYEAVRKMALHLYDSFLKKNDKPIFLDKTTRYYQYLPELFRIFPKAKYIFLLRNPLATLASFIEVMAEGNWISLGTPGIRNDLLDGYRLIREGVWYHGDNAVVIKYEDLVKDPEKEVSRLCEHIGVEFEPDMLNYGQTGIMPGTLVDPKSITKHSKPVKDYIDAYKSQFNSRQEKILARGFLNHLGPELIAALGYSYDEMIETVRGQESELWPMVTWEDLMTLPSQRGRLKNWQISFAFVWQKKGVWAALGQEALRVLRWIKILARLGVKILRAIDKKTGITFAGRKVFPITWRKYWAKRR